MALIDVTLSGGDFGGKIHQIEESAKTDGFEIEKDGKLYYYRVDFLEEENRHIGVLVAFGKPEVVKAVIVSSKPVEEVPPS